MLVVISNNMWMTHCGHLCCHYHISLQILLQSGGGGACGVLGAMETTLTEVPLLQL